MTRDVLMRNPLSTFAFALALLAGGAHAHQGEVHEPGDWVVQRLVVKHDSNWSTEYCMDLQGSYAIDYRFDADRFYDFNFHLHPALENNEYSTIYIDRTKNIREREGRAEALQAGNYCFDFIPVERATEDREIELRYRIRASGE